MRIRISYIIMDYFVLMKRIQFNISHLLFLLNFRRLGRRSRTFEDVIMTYFLQILPS
jgi:hypothetical protein